MTTTSQPLSFYDGRDFQIRTPDGANKDAGYIQPLDSAGLEIGGPVRIAGADPGPNHRYVLDPKNTGHVEDYDFAGPIIGAELDQFQASAHPLAQPIFAKGRLPDPALPADITQVGSTLVQAGQPAAPATNAATAAAPVTPVAPQPAHVVVPAKHVNAVVAVLEKVGTDVKIGAEDAERFFKAAASKLVGEVKKL